MRNKITFGQYEGKTFEWILFKDSQYAQWLHDDGIPHQDHFGDEECEHFMELYRRAASLTGPCPRCQNPITRMGLTTHRNGDLSAVCFYCDQCEFLGGSTTGYFPSSFFVEAYTLEPWEQKMVQSEIVRTYLGGGNFTQKKMEKFFWNDGNFSDFTPGFFGAKGTGVAA